VDDSAGVPYDISNEGGGLDDAWLSNITEFPPVAGREDIYIFGCGTSAPSNSPLRHSSVDEEVPMPHMSRLCPTPASGQTALAGGGRARLSRLPVRFCQSEWPDGATSALCAGRLVVSALGQPVSGTIYHACTPIAAAVPLSPFTPHNLPCVTDLVY
jgi:hypothetical protein